MELYDVMRTTFAARDFTGDPLPDETLLRILENARFAPSGGNRQGRHVVVVREQATRERLAELIQDPARRYVAQGAAGQTPWTSLEPPAVSREEIDRTAVPERFTAPLLRAPVVLVVSADLRDVAALDQDLDRVGVVPGASIYPFVWNVLLAARNEGFGGTLTTMLAAQEPEVQALLGLPATHAIAAVLPMGKPVKQLTRLRRREVADFVTLERYDGPALGG